MRKIFLATASASVLCTFAMQAEAQVVVTLGGYTEFFGGLFNDTLGSNRNKREFELETEIVVKADGKADNGLLYGVKVELQNSTPNAARTATGSAPTRLRSMSAAPGAVSNWAISMAPPTR